MIHILIIGIRSAKAFELEKTFKGRAHFTFITDQQRACRKLKGSYDYIISCVKFTNHSVERLYHDHPAFIRINGGLTALDHTITQIIEQQNIPITIATDCKAYA